MPPSYEHTYRKPEYNAASRTIFQATVNTTVYWNPSGTMLDRFFDALYMQRVFVKQKGDGFPLFTIPESTDSCTVVKSGAAVTEPL